MTAKHVNQGRRKTDPQRARELIAFRIGAQEFCVDIMSVREIRGWTPATALPQSPSFVRGVVNLRGAVLPIVDLSARLGFSPTDPTARHVIIVAQIGNQSVGLLVDAVSDILSVTDNLLQPTPDVASEMVKIFVKGVIAIENRMISLIALDHVLPGAERKPHERDPVRQSADRKRRGPPPGEFVLSREDFRQIAAMLHADAGIHLPETKAALVYSRLARRLRALGLVSFRDYCALVAGAAGADERQKMLAALTTNVTKFFREPHHFDHLERVVLPPLLKAARQGGRVRLWSAACSNGQERYSMTMVILSLMPDAHRFDVRVLASDIDANMLAEAKKGVYAETFAEGAPAKMRQRWLPPVAEGPRGERGRYVAVADELRDLVVFRELNLFGDWPMRGPFQAIFCRNVAIYFEEETQRRLWSRFVPMLAQGGRLYIGHSERLTGAAAEAFDGEGVTCYRLKGSERT